jgi:hypothetical protein
MRAILTAISLLFNYITHKRLHNIDIISNLFISQCLFKGNEAGCTFPSLKYDAVYSEFTLKIEETLVGSDCTAARSRLQQF